MLVWVLVRLVLLLLAGVGGGRGGVAHPVRGSVLLYFTLLTDLLYFVGTTRRFGGWLG